MSDPLNLWDIFKEERRTLEMTLEEQLAYYKEQVERLTEIKEERDAEKKRKTELAQEFCVEAYDYNDLVLLGEAIDEEIARRDEATRREDSELIEEEQT